MTSASPDPATPPGAPIAEPLAAEVDVARPLRRAAVWSLLARALGYPRAWPVADPPGATAVVRASDPPPLADALTAFAAVARDADPDVVAGEYVSLFDRDAPCPPYEGAYGMARPVGKSAELADLGGFYAAFGVAPAVAAPDAEDHVGTELEFMSILAVKEAWALAEGNAEGLAVTRQAQVTFLSDHLGRWAEAFAAELKATTLLPYYVAAADLLAAWVRAEVETLGATPVPVAGRTVAERGDADAFECPMASPDANVV